MTRGSWGIIALISAMLLMSVVGTAPFPDNPDVGSQGPDVNIPDGAGLGPAPLAPAVEPFFTENMGQFGQWSARFYAHGGPFSIALGAGWVAYDVQGADRDPEAGGTVVRVTFPGALDTVPFASGTLGHKNNYLHGQDPPARRGAATRRMRRLS